MSITSSDNPLKCKNPVHIQCLDPDYDPDLAQKLISSSMFRHLSTCNISSKSIHAFLRNLANRQTDKRGQTHLPPPLSEVIIQYDILLDISTTHLLTSEAIVETTNCFPSNPSRTIFGLK